MAFTQNALNNASNTYTVTSLSASVVPMAAIAAPGQSANIQEWRNGGGTPMAAVTSLGNVFRYMTAADTTSTPALMGFSGTNGQCRHQYNDVYSGIQAGNGQGMHLYAYYQITLQGYTQSSAPAFPGTGTYHVYVPLSQAAKAGVAVQGAASQTANLQQWQNNSGAVLASVKADGSVGLATLADSAATNGSLYFSSTTSKLTYKDASGTLHAL